ncbi:MAG: hypothetical protein WDO14_11700 [Bacteroidota bacterium]
MKDDDKFEDVVSNALAKGSSFELPHDFADRVVMMIQQKAMQAEAKRDRLWLIVGIMSMIGALVFVFLTVEFKPTVGIFTFFKGYWGLVVFGVLFVTALHILDRKIISHRSHGSHRQMH